MSDTIHPPEADGRRTLTSLAAALCIHVAILAIMALAFALRGPSNEVTTPIDVQIDSGREGAAQEISQGSAPGPASSSAHASGAALPQGSGANSGFVIPTVRAQSPDSAPPAGGGASFREAGGKTGTGAALPAVQNQLPPPVMAAGQQNASAGAGGAAGSAAGAQRSGQGVSVGSSNTAASPLDLGKLDQAIASRGAGTSGAAGTSAAAGAGQAGGRTGQGTSGGGGQGQGAGGGGTGGSGAGGKGGAGDFSVLWDRPEVNRGRTLLSRVDPKFPPWVSKQGLSLKVTVSFVVMPDGVVSLVVIDRSTGYADVDSAFKDAIRRWRFTAVKDAGPMTGLIPYEVKPE